MPGPPSQFGASGPGTAEARPSECWAGWHIWGGAAASHIQVTCAPHPRNGSQVVCAMMPETRSGKDTVRTAVASAMAQASDPSHLAWGWGALRWEGSSSRPAWQHSETLTQKQANSPQPGCLSLEATLPLAPVKHPPHLFISLVLPTTGGCWIPMNLAGGLHCCVPPAPHDPG